MPNNSHEHHRSGDDVSARLDTHEEVCAERYGMIIQRVGRLEMIIVAAAGVLLCGMAGLIVTLALK